MKKYILLIALIMLSATHFALTKYFYMPGESKWGTHYLYANSMHDSLDFIKLFDSKGNVVDVKITKSQSHFIPNERPNLRLIKVDYSLTIPNDFNYPDSLFRFGLKSRQQYDTTFDYFFYILREKPISNLKIVSPKEKSVDIDVKPVFEWQHESNYAIRNYKFQLAKDNKFTAMILDTILSGNKIVYKGELTPITKYYWRVKSDYFEGDSNYYNANFTTGAKTTWEYYEIDKYHYARDIQMLDSGRLIMTDHQVGFLISDDNGANWTAVQTPNIIPFKVTPPSDGKIFAFAFDYNQSQYKILKSTNNGNTWAVFKSLISGDAYQTDRKFNYLVNSNNEFIFAFKNQLIKYKSIDMEELVYSTKIDTSLITGIAELKNGDIVAVTTHIYIDKDADRGEIYLISDNGKNTTKIFGIDSVHTDFIALNSLENGNLIATAQIETANSKIAQYYLSENQGKDWNLVSEIDNAVVINTINTYDGDLISHIRDSKKLMQISKDYGKSWINISGNIPLSNTAFDIKILNDSTLYYLSNGNRIYQTNIRSGIEMSIYPKGKANSETNKINLNWRNNNRAEKYNLQIAENADFKKVPSINEANIFIDEDLTDNKYTFADFEFNKKYFWRVRPYYENKWMDWYKANSFEVTDISSVLPNYKLYEIDVFPNPASEFLKIQNENVVRIEIIDINGTILINQDIPADNLDVSKLNSGIYLIKIYKNNAIYSAKFVKE